MLLIGSNLNVMYGILALIPPACESDSFCLVTDSMHQYRWLVHLFGGSILPRKVYLVGAVNNHEASCFHR